MLYSYKYKSKVADLYIMADEKFLLRVGFNPIILTEPNEIIIKTIKQLEEYFKGDRKYFDLPLNPKGTEFQKQVWSQLIKIPYGKTKSYKEIAISIGKLKGYRAIGNANNKNPIAIIIPCHRVIGSNNKLTGYAGGLVIKQFLLEHEYFWNNKS